MMSEVGWVVTAVNWGEQALLGDHRLLAGTRPISFISPRRARNLRSYVESPSFFVFFFKS